MHITSSLLVILVLTMVVLTITIMVVVTVNEICSSICFNLTPNTYLDRDLYKGSHDKGALNPKPLTPRPLNP